MKLLDLKGQTDLMYIGKVRILFFFLTIIVMKVTNKISAYDIKFEKEVPDKGQILNEIATFFFELTKDIVANCLIATPTSTIQIWERLERFDVEFVYRLYLDGGLWKNYYSKGIRKLPWGQTLPDGLRRYQKLPFPIFTPTTKAKNDADITEKEILHRGLCTKKEFDYMKDIGFKIIARGTKYAESRGLILVDTKFEFGKDKNGVIKLIDEILTPDSSRYYFISDHALALKEEREPLQLSKEYFRRKLVEKGYIEYGPKDQLIPEVTDQDVEEVRQRYILTYETLLGREFIPADDSNKDYESTKRELEKLGIAA